MYGRFWVTAEEYAKHSIFDGLGKNSPNGSLCDTINIPELELADVVMPCGA
jgi:hypothetical protein